MKKNDMETRGRMWALAWSANMELRKGVQAHAGGENRHKSASHTPHVRRKKEQENTKYNMWAQLLFSLIPLSKT